LKSVGKLSANNLLKILLGCIELSSRISSSVKILLSPLLKACEPHVLLESLLDGGCILTPLLIHLGQLLIDPSHPLVSIGLAKGGLGLQLLRCQVLVGAQLGRHPLPCGRGLAELILEPLARLCSAHITDRLIEGLHAHLFHLIATHGGLKLLGDLLGACIAALS
jgi:hypothetical protein